MSAKQDTQFDSKVTIKIPRNLYNRLHTIVEGSGFNSVTDFVVYVLRDLVSDSAMSNHRPSKAMSEDELTKEEIEAIRKRLQTLGYL